VNATTAMGATFLVLSWAMFVGATLTTGRPKVSASLAFAALPRSVLAVVTTVVGLILEVTP
jgi:hypothetical protein